MSRITRDKLELKTQRVELAAIVQDAAEACRPDYRRAGHELNVTLPAEPIYLRADPVRLAQVFANLLINSGKYTEAGGRISLSAERQGNDVAVKVKDTGVGIPPEMLPRVFDRSRGAPPPERSIWTGIGLSLVKRLVECMAARHVAHSEGVGPGQRVRGASAGPHRTDECSTARAHRRADSGDDHRILIVDDNRDNADSLALLQVTGNNTQAAHDGGNHGDGGGV
jgi:K+-sensing histidine kinase KdpD